MFPIISSTCCPAPPLTLYIAPGKPITHQELIAQLKIRLLAETYTA
jgi:hypothetical protein